MTITKKKSIKTPIIHECLHEDKFAELDRRTKETYDIITGNGTPDKGLVVQMVKVNLTNIEIVKSLNKLDGTIENLTKKYDDSISIATAANHAVETYKKEMRAFDDGVNTEKDYIRNKNNYIKMISDLQHSRYTRWITTIAVVITMLAFIYNSFIKKDVPGTPIAVTRSGKLYQLPDSVQIGIFDIKYNISDSDTTVINN